MTYLAANNLESGTIQVVNLV